MCDSVRRLYYSPLCDTSVAAYRAYIEAVDKVVGDGKYSQQLGECYGSGYCKGRYGGGYDCERRVNLAILGSGEAQDNTYDSGGCRTIISGCEPYTGDSGSEVNITSGDGVEGVAVGVSGDGCGGLRDHDGDGSGSERNSNTADRFGPVLNKPCDKLRACVVGGVNVCRRKDCYAYVGEVGARILDTLEAHGISSLSDWHSGDDGNIVQCQDGRDSFSKDDTVINPKLERNRQERKKKKERKEKRKLMGFDWRKRSVENAVDVGSKDSLRVSLENKWIAENKLALLKAERQYAVLQANDIDADVRKYRTAVCVATERNMVAIEKAHESLKATGNSTADDDDRVHTIVGGDTPPLSSGSISPNSSASLSEFRQLAKAKADVEERNGRLERALESLGLSLEAVEKRSKSVWTDNEHNHMILGQLSPEGYGMDREFCEEGKFRVC